MAREKARESEESKNNNRFTQGHQSRRKKNEMPLEQPTRSLSKGAPTLTFLTPRQPNIISKSQDPLSQLSGLSCTTCHTRESRVYTTESSAYKPKIALPQPEFVSKGHFPFLELPGELRNRIYDLVIPCQTYVLNWVRNNQRSKTLTYHILGKESTLTRRLDPHVIQRRKETKNPRSPFRKAIMEDIYSRGSHIALLWVCKKMYPEASSMFYSKSTIVLRRLKAIRHFLNNLQPPNKLAIRSLSLTYQTYGHTVLTANTEWKRKADLSWLELCESISDECPNLTFLSLDLNLNRCPISFASIRDEGIATHPFKQWMLPLWPFMDKGVPVERFVCRIRSNIVEDTVLEVESQNLRRDFLGEKWQQDVETTKRNAYGEDRRKEKEKTRILRIV